MRDPRLAGCATATGALSDADSGKRPSQGLSEFERGRETFFRILREGTGEHGTQRGRVAAREWCERGHRIGAEGAHAAGPEQLVKQRRQAEHVGAPIPGRASHPLRAPCTAAAPEP